MTVGEARLLQPGDKLRVIQVPRASVLFTYQYVIGDIVTVVDQLFTNFIEPIYPDFAGNNAIIVHVQGGGIMEGRKIGPFCTYLERYTEDWWDIWTPE